MNAPAEKRIREWSYISPHSQVLFLAQSVAKFLDAASTHYYYCVGLFAGFWRIIRRGEVVCNRGEITEEESACSPKNDWRFKAQRERSDPCGPCITEQEAKELDT